MVSGSVITKFVPVALAAALVVLPACSVNVKDKGKTGEGRVDINTPMGEIHVNEQPDVHDTGLSLYAGAKPAPKDNGEDKKSANVNLSGFGFSLRVVASEFVSDDSPDKILSYYNKELQRFGKPIECHGKWTGGDVDTDMHTRGDKNSSKPVSCRKDEGGDSVELKVGTVDNQHIVAVKPEGKGTHFALVYVRTHSGKDNTI
jgi:hypothetical protein